MSRLQMIEEEVKNQTTEEKGKLTTIFLEKELYIMYRKNQKIYLIEFNAATSVKKVLSFKDVYALKLHILHNLK